MAGPTDISMERQVTRDCIMSRSVAAMFTDFAVDSFNKVVPCASYITDMALFLTIDCDSYLNVS